VSWNFRKVSSSVAIRQSANFLARAFKLEPALGVWGHWGQAQHHKPCLPPSSRHLLIGLS